jgi:hypothetical protein
VGAWQMPTPLVLVLLDFEVPEGIRGQGGVGSSEILLLVN